MRLSKNNSVFTQQKPPDHTEGVFIGRALKPSLSSDPITDSVLRRSPPPAPELLRVKDYVQFAGSERAHKSASNMDAVSFLPTVNHCWCGIVAMLDRVSSSADELTSQKQNSGQEAAFPPPWWLILTRVWHGNGFLTKRRRKRRTDTKELASEARKSSLSIHGAAVYFEKRLLFLPCWWIVILPRVRLVFCN